MGIREKPDDLKAGGRLYNLDEEIGELTNVAAQHPEVVKRLQQLADAMIADIGSGKPGPGVRPPGAVPNPVTLFPSQARKPRRPAPAAGKPIDWKHFQIGHAYHTGSIPDLAGKPFVVQATVSGERLQGVVIAHGGSAVGYSLYVADGKVVFAVRSADDVDRVSAAIQPGENRLVAEVAKDELRLRVNGDEPRTAPAAGPLPRHPQEAICLGHDGQNPVDPQAPRGRFRGRISEPRVTVGK